MSTESWTCPRCGSPLIGVEVQGVYDGVLFLRCPASGRAFHRFPEGHWLRERAEPFVASAQPLEDTP